MNFWSGGSDLRTGGRSPKLMEELDGDPRGARNGERIAAIYAAVWEKIAI